MKNMQFDGAIKALLCTAVGMGLVSRICRIILGTYTHENIPLAILMVAVILGVTAWAFIKQNCSSPTYQR
jgi:hypothetical protein